MEKDLLTKRNSHRRLRRFGEKTLSLSKKIVLKKRFSFLYPCRSRRGLLLGERGRAEDPFRKKLAEGPPERVPRRRKQGIAYLCTKTLHKQTEKPDGKSAGLSSSFIY
ncbi:hypothetical protein [Alkalicoccus saliphilus]|uniref:Uncharacterized protein n=1 Tax=Alkalicoccus saliphilus TaxID=200989 RepID=A0A2T4U963_9BACI|nr:hypothetical protein [Alkalicoccus saliphilus]PTL39938.1 hypothetical protein C6Y45_02855 [Alkalicoccus saliphilus]